jgi:hypothetical protein
MRRSITASAGAVGDWAFVVVNEARRQAVRRGIASGRFESMHTNVAKVSASGLLFLGKVLDPHAPVGKAS